MDHLGGLELRRRLTFEVARRVEPTQQGCGSESNKRSGRNHRHPASIRKHTRSVFRKAGNCCPEIKKIGGGRHVGRTPATTNPNRTETTTTPTTIESIRETRRPGPVGSTQNIVPKPCRLQEFTKAEPERGLPYCRAGGFCVSLSPCPGGQVVDRCRDYPSEAHSERTFGIEAPDLLWPAASCGLPRR